MCCDLQAPEKKRKKKRYILRAFKKTLYNRKKELPENLHQGTLCSLALRALGECQKLWAHVWVLFLPNLVTSHLCLQSLDSLYPPHCALTPPAAPTCWWALSLLERHGGRAVLSHCHAQSHSEQSAPCSWVSYTGRKWIRQVGKMGLTAAPGSTSVQVMADCHNIVFHKHRRKYWWNSLAWYCLYIYEETGSQASSEFSMASESLLG